MGTSTAWSKFPHRSFKDGSNGCVIPKNVFDKEFSINISVEKNKMTIVYGNKARNM
jgi:hypothetical protein